MNFQITPLLTPLRVLLVNPLDTDAQMLIVRILAGEVFGADQPIDLIMLVYSNVRSVAEIFKKELLTCAFVALNTVTISTDIPKYSDADVFIFMSSLRNPNYLDYDNIDNDQFDAVYLVLKLANAFSLPETPEKVEEEEVKPKKGHIEDTPERPRRAIVVADGLVTMAMLYNFSHNLPRDVFCCPTALAAIGKSVLGEYLKIRCDIINDVLVWAADDEMFYMDFVRPLFLEDDYSLDEMEVCDWSGASKEFLVKLNLDHTQFNETWMRKDFIEKVAAMATKNPYGYIYKAAKMSRTLKHYWQARSADGLKEFRYSMGVISDGSVHTIKDCAYVLPLIYNGDRWCIDSTREQLVHVKQEIKRINVTAIKQHRRLMKYCKKFLKDNILNEAFIPKDDESGSLFFHSSHRTSSSQ